MAEGKWITDLHATTPLADAARRVLAVRLQVVQDRLPLALDHWKEDLEHVHQLRVGTRRAGTALAVFADCLPNKVFDKTRKHLRTLRRAAGMARDWDVFRQNLLEREQHINAAQKVGLDFLIGYSQAQREAVQESLRAAAEDGHEDWQHLVENTLAEVRKSHGKRKNQQLHDLATPWLSAILEEFDAAASGKLKKDEDLHQVRILGKRLRYGMEIFATCFSREFKQRYYPMVEEMQEILGHANDSRVAQERLAGLHNMAKSSQPALWKRFRPGIDGVLRYHQQRLRAQRRNFSTWWAGWHKSGADEGLLALVQGS